MDEKMQILELQAMVCLLEKRIEKLEGKNRMMSFSTRLRELQDAARKLIQHG